MASSDFDPNSQKVEIQKKELQNEVKNLKEQKISLDQENERLVFMLDQAKTAQINDF